MTRGGPGIYHVTNQGYCSWFEFARAIVEGVGFDASMVSLIRTSVSGRSAPRPQELAAYQYEIAEGRDRCASALAGRAAMLP